MDSAVRVCVEMVVVIHMQCELIKVSKAKSKTLANRVMELRAPLQRLARKDTYLGLLSRLHRR